MGNSIRYRLFWAFLLTSLLAVLGMGALTYYSYDRGFLNYVRRQEAARLQDFTLLLESWYAKQGSWAPLVHSEECWTHLLVSIRPEVRQYLASAINPCDGAEPKWPTDGDDPGYLLWPPSTEAGEEPGLGDPVILRMMLLDRRGVVLAGPQRGVPPEGVQQMPVFNGDNLVGYAAMQSAASSASVGTTLFMKNQYLVLIATSALMLSLTLMMAWYLTSYLARPVQSTARALRQLASKDYAVRIAVTSGDELGQLARDVNELAKTLDDHEKSRARWVADISHELRTPLGIIRGEIEALQDGVFPVTDEALKSLHAEIMRMIELVNDLYTLSLADIGALSYKKRMVDLVEILHDTVHTMQHAFDDRDIALHGDIDEDLEIQIFADPDRLKQLFFNLLQNSLRYTDRGGESHVALELRGDWVLIRFEDSAPGVTETHLARLFDRLFRVESSRNRSKGGAGLGLALCQNIAGAHDGYIEALPSPLGGLRLDIHLPLKGPAADV